MLKAGPPFRWDNGTLQKTSTVAKIWYDGLGRRVVKQIGDDCETTHEVGDWDGAYHYYYDGHKLIETRNASYRVLKQYVWGTQYIDELLEIGVNHDPTDTDETNGGGCEVFFWVSLPKTSSGRDAVRR